MKIFKLPDLGEGLQEAEIVAWHVAEGDTVEADQPMVSVETAKAVVDVPAPYSGKVLRLFGKPGDVAHLGAPLVGFEGDEAATTSTTVVGRMQTSDAAVPEASTGEPRAAGLRATPAIRALARKLDVDLAHAVGSGPGGAVTAADVERLADDLQRLGPLEPLRGARRAMYQAMSKAVAEVAAATVMEDADIGSWTPSERILQRLVRALIAGVRAEPGLNAWFDGRTAARRIHESIDLGLAVDTPDGLFVPVLKNAASLAAAELEARLASLVAAARARTLSPEDLRGASITLSNFGSIAGRYATPVVLPPTVAILGAGRVRDQVVSHNGQPAVRTMVPLSLSFDHRCVTGGEAARFLAAVISDLELAK